MRNAIVEYGLLEPYGQQVTIFGEDALTPDIIRAVADVTVYSVYRKIDPYIVLLINPDYRRHEVDGWRKMVEGKLRRIGVEGNIITPERRQSP